MRRDRGLFDPARELICLTFDVEWASPEILDDLLGLLAERKLKGTFFCTHAGISVVGHERGLHPNFRREGDTLKAIRAELGAEELDHLSQEEIYRRIVSTTHAFCPEATGVRAHSLFYDSQLIRIYHEAGITYDSSYAMLLADNLTPFQKEFSILELPVYYQDHLDLKAQATEFEVANLALDRPGMKVFNFHPNMLFINAVSDAHYLASKRDYHDKERLLGHRHPGAGIRTLFLQLLDALEARRDRVVTMAEVHRRCTQA